MNSNTAPAAPAPANTPGTFKRPMTEGIVNAVMGGLNAYNSDPDKYDREEEAAFAGAAVPAGRAPAAPAPNAATN